MNMKIKFPILLISLAGMMTPLIPESKHSKVEVIQHNKMGRLIGPCLEEDEKELDREKYIDLISKYNCEKENNNEFFLANVLNKTLGYDYYENNICHDGYCGKISNDDYVDVYYFPINYDSNITINFYGENLNYFNVKFYNEFYEELNLTINDYKVSITNTHYEISFKNSGVNDYFFVASRTSNYDVTYAFEVTIETNNLNQTYLNQLKYEEGALGVFQKVKYNTNVQLDISNFLTPTKYNYRDFDFGKFASLAFINFSQATSYVSAYNNLQDIEDVINDSYYKEGICLPYGKLYIWDLPLKRYLSFMCEYALEKNMDEDYSLTKDDYLFIIKNIPILFENLDKKTFRDYMEAVECIEYQIENNASFDHLELMDIIGETALGSIPYAGPVISLFQTFSDIVALFKNNKKVKDEDFGIEATPGSFVKSLYYAASSSDDKPLEIDFNFLFKCDGKSKITKGSILPLIPDHNVGDYSGQNDSIKVLEKSEIISPFKNSIYDMQADFKKITLNNFKCIGDLNFDESDQSIVENDLKIIETAEPTYVNVEDDVYTYDQFESKWYKFVAPLNGEYSFVTTAGNYEKRIFKNSMLEIYEVQNNKLMPVSRGENNSDNSSSCVLYLNKNEVVYIKTFMLDKTLDSYKFALKVKNLGDLTAELDYSQVINFDLDNNSTFDVKFERIDNRSFAAAYTIVSDVTEIVRIDLQNCDYTGLIYVDDLNLGKMGTKQSNKTLDLKVKKGKSYKLTILCENINEVSSSNRGTIKFSPMYEYVNYSIRSSQVLGKIDSSFETGKSEYIFSNNNISFNYLSVAAESDMVMLGDSAKETKAFNGPISKLEINFSEPLSGFNLKFSRYKFNSEIYTDDVYLKNYIKVNGTWKLYQKVSMSNFRTSNLMFDLMFPWTYGDVTGIKCELVRDSAIEIVGSNNNNTNLNNNLLAKKSIATEKSIDLTPIFGNIGKGDFCEKAMPHNRIYLKDFCVICRSPSK